MTTLPSRSKNCSDKPVGNIVKEGVLEAIQANGGSADVSVIIGYVEEKLSVLQESVEGTADRPIPGSILSRIVEMSLGHYEDLGLIEESGGSTWSLSLFGDCLVNEMPLILTKFLESKDSFVGAKPKTMKKSVKAARSRRSSFLPMSELVDYLSGKLPESCLQNLATSFAYRKGEDVLQEVGADYRRQGRLTFAQAGDLVEWKMDRQKTNFWRLNSYEQVMSLTEQAAQQADEFPDDPEKAAAPLRQLSGVDFSIASVFLTAWDPYRFGIIDSRALSALYRLTNLGFFAPRNSPPLREHEFRQYTLLLRCWSEREGPGISPRLLDKALWQYDYRCSREDH